jgi:hypothetical protein
MWKSTRPSGTHGTPTDTEADSIHNLAILRGGVLRESATGPCPGPLECSLTSQNLLHQHSNQSKSVYLHSPLRERHNARQHRPVRISVNKKIPPGNTVEEHAQNDVTISAS